MLPANRQTDQLLHITSLHTTDSFSHKLVGTKTKDSNAVMLYLFSTVLPEVIQQPTSVSQPHRYHLKVVMLLLQYTTQRIMCDIIWKIK